MKLQGKLFLFSWNLLSVINATIRKRTPAHLSRSPHCLFLQTTSRTRLSCWCSNAPSLSIRQPKTGRLAELLCGNLYPECIRSEMRGDSGGWAPDVMGEIQTGRSLHDRGCFSCFCGFPLTQWQHSVLLSPSQKEPLCGPPTDFIHYRRPSSQGLFNQIWLMFPHSAFSSWVTCALIWKHQHNYRQTRVRDHVFCVCLFCFMFRCAAQAGGRTGREPPLWLSPKKQVFFFFLFDLFPLGCPRRIISAFASADFGLACIFMGRCDLRTNIPMQTDSSRFHGCEGCELHANKLASLMNQTDIFRNVLFSRVRMYGLSKSSDWLFFCLSSLN